MLDYTIIAIITDASVNDGSFQSVQMLIEKHPGRVIHEVWPDGEQDDTEKLENMEAIIAKIATNLDVKTLVINSVIDGTSVAVDKLLETRDDVLIIYCAGYDDSMKSSQRADIVLISDYIKTGLDIILISNYTKMGYEITRLANESGAKTFVNYSVARHMFLPSLTARHDILKSECERLPLTLSWIPCCF